MKVWITKYALTQGIMESEAAEAGDSVICQRRKRMINAVVFIGEVVYTDYFHGEGNEWHLTRASAVRRAEKMREAKMRVLQKQIVKLRCKVFK